MRLVETLLETKVALLEADRACGLAESRLADLKALLEEVRAERDYWCAQAQLLEQMRADRDYWREQAQRPVSAWWKRTTEWSSQHSALESLS